MVPKLFQKIAPRYANRPGGYTRVLRIEPLKEDQAESAILELVDGPNDMRFLMTAKTLAQSPTNKQFSEKTAENVKKVIRYRKDGVEELKDMVGRLRLAKKKGGDDRILPAPRKVYPEEKIKRDMHYFEDVDHHMLPNRVIYTGRSRHTKRKENGLSERKEKAPPVIREAQTENAQAS
jgi:large subunit ribosomal protein L17